MKWVLAALLVLLVACSSLEVVEEDLPNLDVDTAEPADVEVKESPGNEVKIEEVKEEPEPSEEPELVIAQQDVSEVLTDDVPEQNKSDIVNTSAIHYADYEPFSNLGCERLLTASEFASACSFDEDEVEVNSRIGTQNCYVAIIEKANPRLTAGVSLRAHDKAEDAEEEFNRRLQVLTVGADKTVGDRAYTLTKINREELEFLKGNYIVNVGSDIALCNKKEVKALALVIDQKLKTE